MTKKVINTGSGPNSRDGDSLRSAFTKINENFTELYTALGLNADINLNLGAFEFTGSTMTTTDSTAITIDQQVNITSDLVMSGDVVPATTDVYDLGTPDKQWRSLYLTGSTVYFNGIPLSVTDDGTIIVNGEVAATPGGALTWDSITGKPTTTASDGLTATTDINGNVNIGFSGILYVGSQTQYGFEEIVDESGPSPVYSSRLSLPLTTEFLGGDISLTAWGPGVNITVRNTDTLDEYSWSFGNDGDLTVPDRITFSDNTWQSTAFIGHAYELRNSPTGNLYVTLDDIGTINTPLLLPRSFTAVLDTEHFYPQPGIGLTDAPWEYGVEFQVNPDGTVQAMLDDPVRSVNPGYVNGHVFRFTEADHGIPGYTFDLTLITIINDNGNLVAEVGVTQPPAYPSTVKSLGAIKLTSNDKSWVFGTDGKLKTPAGLEIYDELGQNAIISNSGLQISSIGGGQLSLIWNLGEGSPPDGPNQDVIASGIFQDTSGVSIEVIDEQSDSKSWRFRSNGILRLPAGGDIVDSNGQSVLGGGGSISVGDGNGPSVENVTEILINGTITEIEPGLVGISISGGTNQPYLELTNTPFIIQPVVSGTPVTVTSPAQGEGAQVEIVIGEGPVITSVTATTAGTGYAVGQRYRVWYWQVGGNNDDSSIDFEVATVGENGELLTVTNAAFTGISLSNIPATYSGVSIELQSSMVFDEIGPGLTLTRNQGQALYNSELELEYDRDTYLSPLGTEWNNDGWDNLVGFRVRNYTTFRSALNNAVGENIIGAELIMRDVANDRYYKFSFSVWGGNNGAYTYTRTEITDPNFFEKLDYATANDVDVIEDDSTLQIGITRGEQNGIYNPFTEEGWDSDVSPDGTLWNIDGWDDLSDIETRTYTTFYNAYDGNLGNRIPGSKAVMYVPSIDKYYGIQWLRWTQGINGNAQGGGFSYLRYELDLTKLQEGITFADGTKLKSAEGIGRVKLTAPGNRRIEEAHGYKQISVTSRITGNTVTTTAVNSNENNTWFVDISAIGEVRQGLISLDESGAFYEIEVSADENNWIKGNVGGWGENSIQITFINGSTLSFNQGDTVYYRVITGSDPVVWWDKNELPGGSSNFRGAIIDYHAYTGESTIIGTIHIVDDDGEENITHAEVTSGTDDGENDDLWVVTNEGQIKYRRIDGESKTLKVQWSARVFYGSELYD